MCFMEMSPGRRCLRFEKGVPIMLLLSRKAGESVVLPSCHVTITVVRLGGNRVRLGIDAPRDVAVHREEVWFEISEHETSPISDHDQGPAPAKCLPR